MHRGFSHTPTGKPKAKRTRVKKEDRPKVTKTVKPVQQDKTPSWDRGGRGIKTGVVTPKIEPKLNCSWLVKDCLIIFAIPSIFVLILFYFDSVFHVSTMGLLEMIVLSFVVLLISALSSSAVRKNILIRFKSEK